MKNQMIGALALTLAIGQIAVAPAFAEPATASHFRTAPAQTFSAEDLQRYGLDADASARAVALQSEGYHILALTPAEAASYQAGDYSQTTWILIGVGVLVILAVL